MHGTADLPPLLGGHPALDFVNTVDPRHGDAPHEYLPDYAALVRWARHAGLDAPPATRAQPAVHRRALVLREALYRLFSGTARTGDLETLGTELRDALSHVELRRVDGAVAWHWSARPPEAVLWPVVVAADELLRSTRLERVRECPGEDGCGWLFLDTSRNGTRRWCSMEVCGNRAKVRRHRGHRLA